MQRLGLFILLLFAISAYAQQEPLFTQYYVNSMPINPAVSGSAPYNHLSIQTRQQWLGFEGAPLTTYISYDGALNNRSAMGGYLLLDRAYPSTQVAGHLNYAYHIPLDYDNINLSFGIGAKVMYHNLDFNNSDELPPDQDDAFSLASHNQSLADASAGVYLYSRQFYFGFSSSNLLESSFNDAIPNSPHPNSEFRNYYGMGGYRFFITNRDWQLEPSFLIRKMHSFPAITDLTARILYQENLWSGITYRTDGTAVFSFGFGSGVLHCSYSYDHTFSGDIQKYSYGTHEIALSFRIVPFTDKRSNVFWGY